jgi:hypothetical protein
MERVGRGALPRLRWLQRSRLGGGGGGLGGGRRCFQFPGRWVSAGGYCWRTNRRQLRGHEMHVETRAQVGRPRLAAQRPPTSSNAL